MTMFRVLTPLFGVVALAALGLAPTGARNGSMKDLTFLTRQGCGNTDKMRSHLDVALEHLGLLPDYKVVDIGALPSTDAWTGYPTPTLLYKGKDLFGLPSPRPPYPEPS